MKLLFGLLKAAVLLSFFTALGVPNCFSQTSGGDQSPNPYASPYYRPIPKTPEAAALGKFGDVPVSYNTGIPNITIPIYTLNTRSLSLPISIDYHAGGIKVNEVASAVGLGWALNAGGMITHIVVGKSDFAGGQRFPNCMFPQDYSIDIPTSNIDFNNSINNHDYRVAINFAQGDIDLDPDVFSCSFLGKSFKFVVDDSLVPRPIPYSPVKILFQGVDILIVDETGTNFFFKRTEEVSPIVIQTIRGSCNGNNIGNVKDSYNYLLSKMKSLDGDSILFEYELYGTNGVVSYPTDYTETEYHRTSYIEYFKCNPGPNEPLHKFQDATCKTGISVRFASRIKRINGTNNTSVNFNYSASQRLDLPGANALESIMVISGTDTLRKFKLGQSYSSSRLFLDAFERVGAQPYSFTYFNKDNLPERFSFSQDHWGYYNGRINDGLTPKVAFHHPTNGLINIGSANRKPSFPSMKYGSLFKITFPTGGYTTFDYEPNVVWGPSILDGRSACTAVDSIHVIANPDYSWGVNHNDSVRTTIVQFQVATNPSVIQEYFLAYDLFHYTNQVNGVDPLLEVSRVESNGSLTPIVGFSNGKSISTGYWLKDLAIGNYQLFVRGTMNRPASAQIIRRAKQCESSSVNTSQVAGGLRVKHIKSFNPGSALVVRKSYEYFEENGNSSATYQGRLSYSNYLEFMDKYCEESVCVACGFPNTYTIRYKCGYVVFSSTSSYQSTNNSGSPVNYSVVTELYDSLNVGGKSEYRYLSVNDVSNAISDFAFTSPTSYGFLRGLLLELRQYKRILNGFELVNRIYNSYEVNHQILSTASTYTSQQRGYLFNDLSNNTHKLRNERVIVGAALQQSNVELPLSVCSQGLLAEFVPIYYRHISAWTPLVYTKEVSYDHLDTNRKVIKEFFYKYSNPKHAQVTEVKTVDDARDTLISWIKYPQDYSLSGAYSSWASEIKAISRLRMLHAVSLPVERVSGIKKSSTNIVITSGTSNLFEPLTLSSGYSFPVLRRVNVLRLTTPVSFASFPFSTISGNSFSSSSFYGLMGEVVGRTPLGSWSEIRERQKGTISRLWGYGERFPIAEAMNASVTSIGYTSFENEDKGRFTYSGAKSSTEFYTGRFSYQLNSGSISLSVSPAQKFKVSFWAKGTGQVVVGTATVSVSSSTMWKQYNVDVVASSTILISTVASGLLIDELRVHPVTATMSTFAYEPESGVTSIGSPNSITSLFDYDRLGRLSAVRNSSNEIEKVIQYQYGTTFAAPPQFLMNSVQGPLNQYVGLPTLFAAQGVESSNSVPFIYDWNFGNGQVASGRSVTYAYPSTGNFAVTLRIRHPNFTTDLLQTGSINIGNCPLISGNMTYSPSAPTTSDLITLNANASAGCGPFTYRWDWRATGSQTWNLISGATSSTCSISGGINNCSGFVVRCRVSNANQTFRDFEQPLEPISTCVASTFQITTSPNPFYIADVVSCTISSTSQCPPLTYSWEGKPLNETTWSNLGSSQTISLQPPIASEGYQVRCTVTGSPAGPFTITKLLNPADGCPGCSY